MTFVKICGLTREKDVHISTKYGADFLGFIVDVPVTTPRNLSIEKASELLKSVPPTITSVAVIMPRTMEEVVRVMSKVCPGALQFHGSESPEFIKEVKKIFPEVKVIKAFHVKFNSKADEFLELIQLYEPYVDIILLDTWTPRGGGGSGKIHNWQVGREICEKVSKPLFLSGGLTRENVCKAIKTVKPWGVDASSGLEVKPGVKDEEKIRDFVKEVRRCCI